MIKYMILFFMIFLTSIMVWADECKTLMPMYQQSVRQLKAAENAFLKASCQENPDKKECIELSTAVREIQGVLQMFVMRLKSLACDPQKQTLNPCQKFKKIQEKADIELKELQRQSKAQRCQYRKHTPPCRALVTAQKKPRLISKAARDQLIKNKCQ